MKFVIIVFSSFLFISNGFICKEINLLELNKCNSYYDSTLNRRIYYDVSEKPVFYGGYSNFIKLFAESFEISKFKNEDEFFEFYFKFNLIIDCNGEVIKVSVDNKDKEKYNEMEIEGIRVIYLMPKWIPGKCEGRAVPVQTKLLFRIIPR
ncbi:MAG: hypothetical protein U0W24_24020 [Bacteroidales bacterium]